LLRNSDNGQEWIKIQAELQEAQEKTQTLTDMINELRNSLTDTNSKYELGLKDLETAKHQLINDKQKHQQEVDAIRLDKTKREEMFKTLVSELKEVVTTVQRELQLKDVDWGAGMKGPMSDRLKNIKEDLANIKKNVIEKLKLDRDELKQKMKMAEDTASEMQLFQKKAEELENKVKEKDIRIGQMNNFINTTKAKIQSQKQQIEDLTKQLSTNTSAQTPAQASISTISSGKYPN
jgi:DNA repair exonuclease SbcCD ATPase subunit